MDNTTILHKMPDYTVTRKELLQLIRENDSSFSEGQMKRFLEHMINNSQIEHVGRNKYRKIIHKENTVKYENQYSKKAFQIIAIMQKEFPLLEYRIWESSWLNEFFHHQLSHNYIFLEVENDGCEFVFDRMTSEFQGNVLLKPDQDQMLRYGSNNSIIIDRLIEEAPKEKTMPYNLAIEKIVVDLFANKRLRGMLSLGDYPDALETIFSLYKVNQVKMFRYARRRNKEKELLEFLNNKTNVEVKVI